MEGSHVMQVGNEIKLMRYRPKLLLRHDNISRYINCLLSCGHHEGLFGETEEHFSACVSSPYFSSCAVEAHGGFWGGPQAIHCLNSVTSDSTWFCSTCSGYEEMSMLVEEERILYEIASWHCFVEFKAQLLSGWFLRILHPLAKKWDLGGDNECMITKIISWRLKVFCGRRRK